MKHGNLLTVLILVGLAAGAIYGQFVLYGEMGEDPDTHWTKQAGDLILIRPLYLLIIPLVFVSVVMGMTSIGDPSKLGVVGASTLLYYLVTMLIARRSSPTGPTSPECGASCWITCTPWSRSAPLGWSAARSGG